MANRLFLDNRLREKFLSQNVKEFNISLPQDILDIEDKTRSNLFSWRGQFAPQLVENLIFAYAPKTATILDPFLGSGTVVYEAGCLGLKAFGCELNPAAWILSRTYQLINLTQQKREQIITSVTQKLEIILEISNFFDIQYHQPLTIEEFQQNLSELYDQLEDFESIIVHGLVILLDISENHNLTREQIYHTACKLYQLIRELPYSEAKINPVLGDARQFPLEEDIFN